jgi:hypothetical protein
VNPALYAITFAGSFVHNSSGISGTASANATATTGFNDTNINVTNVSFGYYGTWVNTNQITFGNTTSAGGPSFLFAGNSVRIAGGGGGGTTLTTSVSGLQFVSTSTGTAAYGFRNQFQTVSFTRGTTTSGSWIIQLSRTADVTLNTMKLAFIAEAYTSAEALLFEKIIEQYQEFLSRQDYTINPNFDIYTNRFINTVGAANLLQIEQTALDYLITNLRNTTIFAKLAFLFPVLGTTAATQVRDVISLSSLSLSGSFTHTSQGMDPQTTASFALTPTGSSSWTTLGWNQAFIALYINEQNTTNGFDHWGIVNRFDFQATNGTNALSRTFGAGGVSTVNTTTTGFWITNAPGFSLTTTLYRNGSSFSTHTAGTNNSFSGPYFFATNAGLGSLRRQALMAWGPTVLTVSEVTDFNNIVQQYQTLLGRA